MSWKLGIDQERNLLLSIEHHLIPLVMNCNFGLAGLFDLYFIVIWIWQLLYETRNRLSLLIITMVCCNSASWISRFLEKISFQDQQVFWGFNWSTKTSFAKLASCTLIFLPDCRCDFFAADFETSWNTTWLSNVSFHLSSPDDLQFWSLAGPLHLLTQITLYFSYYVIGQKSLITEHCLFPPALSS